MEEKTLCFVDIYRLPEHLNKQQNGKMDGKQNIIDYAKYTKIKSYKTEI